MWQFRLRTFTARVSLVLRLLVQGEWAFALQIPISGLLTCGSVACRTPGSRSRAQVNLSFRHPRLPIILVRVSLSVKMLARALNTISSDIMDMAQRCYP